MLLAGRVVVLTGATGGIGRRLAVGLAEQGTNLVVHHHQAEAQVQELLERVRERGRAAVSARADLRDPTQAVALVETAVATFGRCDVLINNAGAAQRRPFLEVSPDLWRQAFAVNVDSAFFCTQAAARQMIRQGGGKIINMGSIVAELATVSLVPYCAAKAALHMLTKATAVALAPHRITVNAIAPGVVTTEKMQGRLRVPGNLPPILARTPTGTLVAPEDLVGVAVFLASSLADHLTGQIITVDHGYTLEGLAWQPDA
jgi:NAD(P)-dependent dehydrogenase (short-subunit alcohol dehydrogenase family)